VSNGLPSIHLSTSNPNLLSVDLTDSSGLGTSVSPSMSTVDSAAAVDKLQEQFYTQAKAGQYYVPTLYIRTHRPVSTTCLHCTYIHTGQSVLRAYTAHTCTQAGQYYLSGRWVLHAYIQHAAHTYCSVWLEAVICHWTAKKNCSVCSIRWLVAVPFAGRRLARTSSGQEVQVMEMSFHSCMLKCTDGCSSRDVEDGLSHDHDGERAAEACHWAGLSTAVS